MNLEADPLKLGKFLWPEVTLYKQQKEIVESVWNNRETVVPAGHQLGKDFVAGYIVLLYFLSHHPCRVVTTSVKDDHLRVLWGEIKRFLQQMSKRPTEGSRLIVNFREIKRYVDGEVDEISYIYGTVSERPEGLAGHHAKYTLAVIDEASGVADDAYQAMDSWAKRRLIIGNPYPCSNFFFRGVTEGDLKDKLKNNYARKVIKIKAQDSPNVRFGVAQARSGDDVTDEEIIPGVIGYSEYFRRRHLWDKVKQCVGLDAEFYLGSEVLMYPPEWLNEAEDRARHLLEESEKDQKATTMGIDVGEGEAETSWAIGNDLTLINLISHRTRDTAQIVNKTIRLIKDYKIPPENVFMDRGGGGKQCADQLRERGYEVKTVAFGEALKREIQEGYVPVEERQEFNEEKYAYRNRRAQMYGILRERVNPANGQVYGIPAKFHELRRQLSLIPLRFDQEGRMLLPPKSKPRRNSKQETLIDIIGRSPDEADALVLLTYGLTASNSKIVLGPIF